MDVWCGTSDLILHGNSFSHVRFSRKCERCLHWPKATKIISDNYMECWNMAIVDNFYTFLIFLFIAVQTNGNIQCFFPFFFFWNFWWIEKKIVRTYPKNGSSSKSPPIKPPNIFFVLKFYSNSDSHQIILSYVTLATQFGGRMRKKRTMIMYSNVKWSLNNCCPLSQQWTLKLLLFFLCFVSNLRVQISTLWTN